jgi:hypothetical protein
MVLVVTVDQAVVAVDILQAMVDLLHHRDKEITVAVDLLLDTELVVVEELAQ